MGVLTNAAKATAEMPTAEGSDNGKVGNVMNWSLGIHKHSQCLLYSCKIVISDLLFHIALKSSRFS